MTHSIRSASDTFQLRKVPGPFPCDEGGNVPSAGNNLPFPKTSGGSVFL